MRAAVTTTAVLAGAVAAALALPGAATADPTKGDALDLVCGSRTLSVQISPGNGDYTPAHVVGTNEVLIPHAFGAFTGTVYDGTGAVVDSFTEPGETKGSGKQKTDITCIYSFDEVSDGSDPEFPAGYRFVGSGSVTGKLTR